MGRHTPHGQSRETGPLGRGSEGNNCETGNKIQRRPWDAKHPRPTMGHGPLLPNAKQSLSARAVWGNWVITRDHCLIHRPSTVRDIAGHAWNLRKLARESHRVCTGPRGTTRRSSGTNAARAGLARGPREAGAELARGSRGGSRGARAGLAQGSRGARAALAWGSREGSAGVARGSRGGSRGTRVQVARGSRGDRAGLARGSREARAGLARGLCGLARGSRGARARLARGLCRASPNP